MEWIERWWPMIITIIGFIVWLIRLESKVNSNYNMYEQHRVVCKDDKTQERIIGLQGFKDCYNLQNCLVYDLDTTTADSLAYDIYGFSGCVNLNNCVAYQ